MASATVFAATYHLHIIILNRVRQLCLPCCLRYLLIAFIHACMLVPNTFREYMLTALHMKCTKNFKKKKKTQNLTCHSLFNLAAQGKNTTYIEHDLKNVINNTSLRDGVILVSVWAPPSWRLIRPLLPQALILKKTFKLKVKWPQPCSECSQCLSGVCGFFESHSSS